MELCLDGLPFYLIFLPKLVAEKEGGVCVELVTLDGTASFGLSIAPSFPTSSKEHIFIKDFPYYLVTILTLKKLKCLVLELDILAASSSHFLPKISGSTRC